MTLYFASVSLVEGYKIHIVKEAFYSNVDNRVCDEIRTYAINLNLDCLKYLNESFSCFFNYDQREDILIKEIPLLMTKNLSQESKKILEELNFFIQDRQNPYGFLNIYNKSLYHQVAS